MRAFGRGGVAGAVRPTVAGFARPSEPLAGNDLPPWTGSGGERVAKPGPGPGAAGELGEYDGYSGTDPARPRVPRPTSPVVGAWSEGDPGSMPGRSLPPPPRGAQQWDGNPSRLPGGLGGDPLPHLRPSFWRGGIQGFNDQLQYRDRHAYYDAGTQLTGITPSVPGNPPNQHSDGPARPDLRTVNRSVNPQIGSDASRNQDDLSRPYTWLGQWDGSSQAVYGGVPGLYVPYGTRGGIPYAIHSPVTEGAPGDGPAMVFSGPPHGLHSQTIAGARQVVGRFEATPQMRPVRLDRPSNSTSAGQSYSQTVQPQGADTAPPAGRGRSGSGLSLRVNGRGWLGG
jgi:hypothetical protein